MKKKLKENSENVKTDLKHDTLEFIEPIEETNKPITDKDINKKDEEEDITAEELDILETDDTDSLAYALDSVETDVKQDEDNLPDEDWSEDLPDIDASDDTDDEYHRK